MRHLRAPFIIVALSCVLFMSGCASTKTYSYKQFHAHPPRSIVVAPMVNETTDITAPLMHITSISRPLGERGYYVFPLVLTETLFHDFGLTEAGHIHQLPPQKFYDYFGADAVLFVTIQDWSSKFVLIQNTRVIKAHYLLVDTRTGIPLWDRTETLSQGSGGGNLGEIVANAIAEKLISEMAVTMYRPISTNLNIMTVSTRRSGLPFGPYHPDYGKDLQYYPE